MKFSFLDVVTQFPLFCNHTKNLNPVTRNHRQTTDAKRALTILKITPLSETDLPRVNELAAYDKHEK
jgi:hypothetical protein